MLDRNLNFTRTGSLFIGGYLCPTLDYLASDAGKAWYTQRATSIEPFFATIKDLFDLNPLPVQGKTKASAFILLALYAWNLIVLFNFLNDRPLGEVKPILDCL